MVEFVGDTGGERILGADNRQVDRFGSGEADEARDISWCDVDWLGDLVDAGAAVGTEKAFHNRALAEPPA